MWNNQFSTDYLNGSSAAAFLAPALAGASSLNGSSAAGFAAAGFPAAGFAAGVPGLAGASPKGSGHWGPLGNRRLCGGSFAGRNRRLAGNRLLDRSHKAPSTVPDPVLAAGPTSAVAAAGFTSPGFSAAGLASGGAAGLAGVSPKGSSAAGLAGGAAGFPSAGVAGLASAGAAGFASAGAAGLAGVSPKGSSAAGLAGGAAGTAPGTAAGGFAPGGAAGNVSGVPTAGGGGVAPGGIRRTPASAFRRFSYRTLARSSARLRMERRALLRASSIIRRSAPWTRSRALPTFTGSSPQTLVGRPPSSRPSPQRTGPDDSGQSPEIIGPRVFRPAGNRLRQQVVGLWIPVREVGVDSTAIQIVSR